MGVCFATVDVRREMSTLLLRLLKVFFCSISRIQNKQ